MIIGFTSQKGGVGKSTLAVHALAWALREGIDACLNARGIPTARGGQWHTTTVRRLIPMPVKEYAASLAVA